MIGDIDPEDAYDSGDPIDVRLGVLERTVLDLSRRRNEPRFEARRTDARRVLLALAAELDDFRLHAADVLDTLDGL